MAFFPKEEIVLYVKDDFSFEKLMKNVDKFLSVTYLETDKRIKLEFAAKGKAADNKSDIDEKIADNLKQQNDSKISKEVAADFADRKAAKSSLKRGIYELFAEYTEHVLPWGTLTGIRPTKIPMSLLEQGFSVEQIRKNLKEEYLISDKKADLSIDIAIREKNLLKNIDYKDGYSIYIGIPFCPSTCLYCSFTSYPITKWEKNIDAYLEALFREIDYASEAFKDKKLNAIYIGGGTPTTLSAKNLDKLLSKVEDCFNLKYLQELTVEAGRPDSITKEKLISLKKHAVTRISINPQTMKDETLRIIGRHHTAEQTREAYKLAKEIGFDNINMDLIIGLPNETIDDVRNTMEEIVKMKPESVTVHSLAIKRAARLNMFEEDYANLKIENSEEMMNLTAQYCKSIGLEPYYLYRQKNMAGNFENVGYAKAKKAGVYNILIMEEKQTIVACGAGASTKRVWNEPNPDGTHRIERCENVKDVAQYIERIDEMIQRKQQLFSEANSL